MQRKTVTILYCVLSVLFVLNSKANSQDKAWKTLTETSAFECKFSVGKSADIAEVGQPLEFKKDGTPIPSKGEWVLHKELDKGFPSLTFRQIQREEGYFTAQMSGNTDKISEVEGFVSLGCITFIETIPGGGTSVTSIFAEFDGNQELIAIHSRHSLVFSSVIASQYYGSCRPVSP